MFIPDTHILASFDVVSLFTNVPLDLAIKSVSVRWELIGRSIRIKKDEFLSAVNFILTSTYFTFN